LGLTSNDNSVGDFFGKHSDLTEGLSPDGKMLVRIKPHETNALSSIKKFGQASEVQVASFEKKVHSEAS